MNAMEITKSLIEIKKIIKSKDYETALESIDLLLSSDGLTEYNYADAYNYKAICLLELGKYEDALISFDKSYLLDNRLIDHKT